MTAQVTDTTFTKEVLEETDKPVLVDFWAEWCGPCRMLTPVIENISQKYADKLKVVKLNTDENPSTAQDMQVTGLPTCIVFKNGKEVKRIVGFQPQPRFEAELQSALS